MACLSVCEPVHVVALLGPVRQPGGVHGPRTGPCSSPATSDAGASCHETTSELLSGTCSGFADGRRLTINGQRDAVQRDLDVPAAAPAQPRLLRPDDSRQLGGRLHGVLSGSPEEVPGRRLPGDLRDSSVRAMGTLSTDGHPTRSSRATASLVVAGRLALLLLAGLAAVSGFVLSRGGDRAASDDAGRYSCPMHPEVT